MRRRPRRATIISMRWTTLVTYLPTMCLFRYKVPSKVLIHNIKMSQAPPWQDKKSACTCYRYGYSRVFLELVCMYKLIILVSVMRQILLTLFGLKCMSLSIFMVMLSSKKEAAHFRYWVVYNFRFSSSVSTLRLKVRSFSHVSRVCIGLSISLGPYLQSSLGKT